MCIHRSIIQERLLQLAEERYGIPVKWGHALQSLQQDDDAVTVTFSNGKQELFSFIIGCDGLRSDTFKAIFGERSAGYTGLCTVRYPF